MVQLQILNKVLNVGSIDILKDNSITAEYFNEYQEEYYFIIDHFDQFNKVPDKATFFNRFQDLEPLNVAESDEYLVSTLREEYLYSRTVPVLNKVSELLKTNANDAVVYLSSQLPQLKPEYSIGGVDIIKNAEDRFNEYNIRQLGQQQWYYPTGFKELDSIINGWAKGEEFVVFFARTNQGKSWILTKTLTSAWSSGVNVGYISPEMSANKIGYRFDTLNQHFSNAGLVWGDSSKVKSTEYADYVLNLKEKPGKFVVATPRDFNKQITVTKLRNFVRAHDIQILGIDGITYMTDERYKRGDNKTTMLTNISEDLIGLSNELSIPILTVVQSNRGGVKTEEENGTPELENIRDSDGIAQNATKVIALRQTGGDSLELGIKKHRDGRNGDSLTYHWKIDTGDFEYVPDENDSNRASTRAQSSREFESYTASNSSSNVTDVF